VFSTNLKLSKKSEGACGAVGLLIVNLDPDIAAEVVEGEPHGIVLWVEGGDLFFDCGGGGIGVAVAEEALGLGADGVEGVERAVLGECEVLGFGSVFD